MDKRFRRAAEIKNSFVDILNLYRVKEGSRERGMGGDGECTEEEKIEAKSL